MQTTLETPGEGSRDRKWFVYLTDHHEGPFTPHELSSMLSAGKVSLSSYFWCQGMPDWELMTHIQELKSVENPPTSNSALPVLSPANEAMTAEIISEEPTTSTQIQPETEAAWVAPTLSVPDAEQPQQVVLEAREATDAPTGASATNQVQASVSGGNPVQSNLNSEEASSPNLKFSSPKKTRKGPLFALALFLLLGGAIAVVIATGTGKKLRIKTASILESVPVLGAWFAPLPTLSDVGAEEFQDLKRAAGADLTTSGGQVAIALAQVDPSSPKIYVASNLPDGSQVRLQFSGISDTLLGELFFETTINVVINQHLGVATDIRSADRKPLSRGQYRVFAYDAENQDPSVKSIIDALPLTTANIPVGVPKATHAFASRAYFLGGTRDATYTARLKEYHDRLHEKAVAELTELDQIVQTLEQALTSSSEQFKKAFSGKMTASKKAAWKKFDQSWSGMMNQISDLMKTWTSEVLQSEKFYGGLYAKAIETQKLILKAHDIHGNLFLDGTDAAGIDIQVGAGMAQAQTSINEFKSKVEQTRNLPPSPNGMPARLVGGEQ